MNPNNRPATIAKMPVPVVFEAAKDLLEYDLLLDVCIKSISQFPENKTNLLIIPKLLDSVSKEMSKIQKIFANLCGVTTLTALHPC